MASSENLASLEPWSFRPAFPDSWISEAYARETEVLTRALQKSLSSNSTSTSLLSDALNPFLNLVAPDTATAPPTPTASNISGSDPETPVAAKLQRSELLPGATKKATKRKSRASKRSQTTFITADPANFRQMVQQVTGVRFGNSQVPVVSVLKPEPQRPVGGRITGSAAAGCLPTLDTSAFLLDHHHQQQQQQVALGSSCGSGGSGPFGFSQRAVDADAAESAGGLDFETFSSFPTLESWKVM